MTMRQAAKYLNLRDVVLLGMKWNGTGPQYVWCRGRIMYRKKDLDKYLERSNKSERPENNNN